MKLTLYSILDLSADASPEEIDTAYQREKKRLEPHANHDSLNEMKLVQEAYATLSDPERRKQYDQSLKDNIARNNAVIYYSQDTRKHGGATIRLLMISSLIVAGYLAFQHYSQSQPLATSNITPAATPASLPDNSDTPGWADINDIDAVPLPLPAIQRGDYLSFLSEPKPRAFVICRDKRVLTVLGTRLFVKRQLASLPAGCRTYAIDDAVVWQG